MSGRGEEDLPRQVLLVCLSAASMRATQFPDVEKMSMAGAVALVQLNEKGEKKRFSKNKGRFLRQFCYNQLLWKLVRSLGPAGRGTGKEFDRI